MNVLRALLLRLTSQRGQTMSEYAVLITWLVLLVIVGATTLGHNLSQALSSTASRV
jgi:Flp pilus assembly pilin Flp